MLLDASCRAIHNFSIWQKRREKRARALELAKVLHRNDIFILSASRSGRATGEETTVKMMPRAGYGIYECVAIVVVERCGGVCHEFLTQFLLFFACVCPFSVVITSQINVPGTDWAIPPFSASYFRRVVSKLFSFCFYCWWPSPHSLTHSLASVAFESGFFHFHFCDEIVCYTDCWPIWNLRQKNGSCCNVPVDPHLSPVHPVGRLHISIYIKLRRLCSVYLMNRASARDKSGAQCTQDTECAHRTQDTGHVKRRSKQKMENKSVPRRVVSSRTADTEKLFVYFKIYTHFGIRTLPTTCMKHECEPTIKNREKTVAT